MATMSLTIPDAKLPNVLEAFADRHSYTTNALNGETKAQFAKRMVAAHIELVYVTYMGKLAQVSAISAEGTGIIT
jgi:hypothetical protein